MNEEKNLELTPEQLDAVAGGLDVYTSLRTVEAIESAPFVEELKAKIAEGKQRGYDPNNNKHMVHLADQLNKIAKNNCYSIILPAAKRFIDKYWPLV